MSNLRIVLCEPSHPGNVGAVARAMKTMGLADLALVNPNRFPSAEATAMASGADDLLTSARVCPDLPSALAGCGFVLGTSARLRHVEVPQHPPREAIARLRSRQSGEPAAVVFGRERSGLTNAELGLCHELIHIPTEPDFSSLNLAQAVQIVVYEWRIAGIEAHADGLSRSLAGAEHVEGFFQHLERTLWDVDFLIEGQTERMEQRLRRLFLRAELDTTEINILRGILAAVQRAVKKKPDQ